MGGGSGWGLGRRWREEGEVERGGGGVERWRQGSRDEAMASWEPGMARGMVVAWWADAMTGKDGEGGERATPIFTTPIFTTPHTRPVKVVS